MPTSFSFLLATRAENVETAASEPRSHRSCNKTSFEPPGQHCWPLPWATHESWGFLGYTTKRGVRMCEKAMQRKCGPLSSRPTWGSRLLRTVLTRPAPFLEHGSACEPSINVANKCPAPKSVDARCKGNQSSSHSRRNPSDPGALTSRLHTHNGVV
jgi:hypothetical protein